MVKSTKRQSVLGRFGKFGTVGAGGVIVQLVVLRALLEVLNYTVATAIAVETSVLFNFFWHRRWTWSDRSEVSAARAFLRFNLSNGAVSLAVNLCLTHLFVSTTGCGPLVANLLSIAICSILNFTLAHCYAFA
ncbi:MAG TPA: GtrA family protein [Blastocatellia bacterium]|nr:GtrA family protein [Blastocatellia bacterium]